ncbi:DUF2190 family protein [Methylocystis rosea]|uniref:DUF2190 family protein n=1 Tax=Methylocystis rosea TaxID=173366 RepID=UPI000363816D|nr:DUF2190 family protein [Methylocystis rosea]
MATSFIQSGEAVEFAAPYAVASGAGALIGAIFGVAQTTLGNGERGAFQLCGVWELAKNSAEAWTEGAKIYWDNTNKRCTTTASGNTLIGVATEAAANPSSVGRVRLGIVA